MDQEMTKGHGECQEMEIREINPLEGDANGAESLAEAVETGSTDVPVPAPEPPDDHVVVRFGGPEEEPDIGGYRRIQKIAWKAWKPKRSVIVNVNGENVSAIRVFYLNLNGKGRSKKSRGFSIRERVSQYPVVAIGAIGTKRGHESHGYMGKALDFLIEEYADKENALAIVAHTKDPESKLWAEHGFKPTATMPFNGNSLVAYAFNENEFDIDSSYEVPFHF